MTVPWAVIVLTLMPSCGLAAPVPVEAVVPFRPVGLYAGHWGVDLAAPVGSVVAAAAAGVVTFAGEVAGRVSVTIDHGGGVRTSYSYLSGAAVSRGERVDAGTGIGRSSFHGGRPAVHWSLRIGDRYLDPLPRLGCPGSPAAALRLVPSG